MVESDHLEFTMEIWDPDAPARPDPEKPKATNDANISVIQDKAFHFLDMELYWQESCLEFCVHLKKNQDLKYLNKGSTHTSVLQGNSTQY